MEEPIFNIDKYDYSELNYYEGNYIYNLTGWRNPFNSKNEDAGKQKNAFNLACLFIKKNYKFEVFKQSLEDEEELKTWVMRTGLNPPYEKSVVNLPIGIHGYYAWQLQTEDELVLCIEEDLNSKGRVINRKTCKVEEYKSSRICIFNINFRNNGRPTIAPSNMTATKHITIDSRLAPKGKLG